MSDELAKDKGELVGKLYTRLDEIKNSIPGEVKNATQDIKNNVDKLTSDLVEADKQVKALEIAMSKKSNYESEGKNDPKELEKLNKFFRGYQNNDAASIELKALRTDSNPDGGYLVLPEVDSSIGKILFDTSPISRLAAKKTGSIYKKYVRDTVNTQDKYKQELEATSNKDTPEFKEVEITLKTLYGKFPISDEMLRDSSFNVESELLDFIQESFSLDMERDLVSGNGLKTARGLFTYSDAGHSSGSRTYSFGSFETIPSGSDTGIGGVDNIINMYFALKSRYVPNATWLMKSFTHRDILKLKSSNNYHFLGFQPSDRNQVPTLAIMGRPIEYCEDMDANGTQNNIIIGFGDVARTYTVLNNPGITILRDIYSGDGQVIYKITKRYGGGATNFDSFKYMDVNAS